MADLSDLSVRGQTADSSVSMLGRWSKWPPDPLCLLLQPGSEIGIKHRPPIIGFCGSD
jgi:hypothetical protein